MPHQYNTRLKTASIIVISYMAIPLIYMATEHATALSLVTSIHKGGFWQLAPTLTRYMSAATSRILDYAGLPIFSGIGIAYIINTWQQEKSTNYAKGKQMAAESISLISHHRKKDL